MCSGVENVVGVVVGRNTLGPVGKVSLFHSILALII